ncbi:MAG: nuclear transport factor 2 family protein [Gemmatimonadota bacterium]|nr:MAG: nuclear transport factor 2 family protein [Gemmatimonadota bacterium]
MIRATFFFLLALFAVGATVSARVSTVQRQSEDEQTLWSLENAYFAHLAIEDLETLESFWHADFVGWPSHSPEPVGRSAARQSLAELLADTEVRSIDVRPLAVVIRGDVAVTHCFVDLQQRDSETEVSLSSLRVTHTWLREGATWKVIGGMSAR